MTDFDPINPNLDPELPDDELMVQILIAARRWHCPRRVELLVRLQGYLTPGGENFDEGFARTLANKNRWWITDAMENVIGEIENYPLYAHSSGYITSSVAVRRTGAADHSVLLADMIGLGLKPPQKTDDKIEALADLFVEIMGIDPELVGSKSTNVPPRPREIFL